jgi:RimJ/RimL family protein N-acetyltransferase
VLAYFSGRNATRPPKAYLRLDCVAWNESLRAYYERAGYEHVGDVTLGSYTEARYEKRVVQ